MYALAQDCPLVLWMFLFIFWKFLKAPDYTWNSKVYLEILGYSMRVTQIFPALSEFFWILLKISKENDPKVFLLYPKFISSAAHKFNSL